MSILLSSGSLQTLQAYWFTDRRVCIQMCALIMDARRHALFHVESLL